MIKILINGKLIWKKELLPTMLKISNIERRVLGQEEEEEGIFPVLGICYFL
jgi:hypothetical protein